MGKWALISWIFLANLVWIDLSGGQEADRPFYEYPGDYRQQVNQLKADFKSRFGYELLDMELSWKPEEIKELTHAFSL